MRRTERERGREEGKEGWRRELRSIQSNLIILAYAVTEQSDYTCMCVGGGQSI